MAALTDIDIEAPDDTIDSSDQIVADIINIHHTTCAISTAGKVKCWGVNDRGAGGYGDSLEYGGGIAGQETPADRGWHDFGSKVIAIAGGESVGPYESTCALTETGEIYCWGEGSLGQIGNNSTADVGDDELATDMAPSPIWGPAQASPDTISAANLVQWYDASDASTLFTDSGCSTAVSSDGDSVGCWQDKSTNGGSNHVIQATAGNQPTYQTNEEHGLSVVEFDGTDDFLSIASMTNGMSGNAKYTVFVVVKSTSGDDNSNHIFFSHGDTNSNGKQIRIEWDHLNNRVLADYLSGFTLFNDYETRHEGETTLLSLVGPGSGDATSKEFYFNGSSENHTDSGTATLNLDATEKFNLGSWANGNGTNFGGQFMEVIVYKTNLATSERQAVESYLRNKWQKGVDGIATNKLLGHWDAYKAESMTSDVCSTGVTTATTSVQCWKDRSPAGNDLEQTDSAEQPTLVTSSEFGVTAVDFDGGDIVEGFLRGSAGGDVPFSEFTAFMPSAAGHVKGHGSTWTSNDGRTFLPLGTYILNGADNAVIFPNPTADVKTYASDVYDQGNYQTASNHVFRLKGIDQTSTGTGGSGGALNLVANAKFALGGNPVWGTGSLSFDGEIAEHFHYERIMSGAEQAENDVYMAKKWGFVADNTKAPGGVAHGLVLWLDADDSSNVSTADCTAAVAAPSDGNSLGCWKDKSGKGNHLSDNGTVTYETGELNGRPAILFNNGSVNLTGLNGMSGADNPFTVFMVFDKTSNSAEATLLNYGLQGGDNTQKWSFTTESDGDLSNTWHTNKVSTSDTPINVLGKPFVGTMNYEGGGVGNNSFHNIYVNGAKKVTAGGSGTTAAAVSTMNIAIGRAFNNGQPHYGHIAEVVMYDRLLSDAERQDVEAYLSQKWLDEPYYRNCQELYNSGQTTDGDYTIDIDGYNGPRPPMTATCDFITSGNGQGGWTLIMNYVRDGSSSTDAISAVNDRLPLMVSNTLGDDEVSHATAWGHTAPSLLSNINFTEIRVNCQDDSHSRGVDFSTTSSTLISLLKTGAGQVTAFEDFTELANDSANMGSSSVSGYNTTTATDQVYGYWMQGGGGNEFTPGGFAGGTTWECDNNTNTHTNSTIHRFWVK